MVGGKGSSGLSGDLDDAEQRPVRLIFHSPPPSPPLGVRCMTRSSGPQWPRCLPICSGC